MISEMHIAKFDHQRDFRLSGSHPLFLPLSLASIPRSRGSSSTLRSSTILVVLALFLFMRRLQLSNLLFEILMAVVRDPASGRRAKQHPVIALAVLLYGDELASFGAAKLHLQRTRRPCVTMRW